MGWHGPYNPDLGYQVDEYGLFLLSHTSIGYTTPHHQMQAASFSQTWQPATQEQFHGSSTPPLFSTSHSAPATVWVEHPLHRHAHAPPVFSDHHQQLPLASASAFRDLSLVTSTRSNLPLIPVECSESSAFPSIHTSWFPSSLRLSEDESMSSAPHLPVPFPPCEYTTTVPPILPSYPQSPTPYHRPPSSIPTLSPSPTSHSSPSHWRDAEQSTTPEDISLPESGTKVVTPEELPLEELPPLVVAYQLEENSMVLICDGAETAMPWMPDWDNERHVPRTSEDSRSYFTEESSFSGKGAGKRAHRKTIHRCAECGRWFDRASALTTHMRVHSGVRRTCLRPSQKRLPNLYFGYSLSMQHS